MTNRTLVAISAAVALVSWAPAALAQDPPANLAGHWKLNKGLSDDVEAKALEAAGGRKTVGKDAVEADRLELRTALLGLLPALGSLDIEQSSTEVKLVDAEDNVRIFYFGREHVREGRLGRKVRCSTEWKGSQLVVTEIAEGGKLIELLTSVPSRKQVLHVVRLEDKRLKAPLEIRLAYDAADAPKK